MATVQHTAPRGFPKALSGVRSAVFPVTSAVLVTIPCDIPRWRTPAGTAMLFVPVNGFECDGTHLTHDGELVIVSLLEKRDMLRFIYPDMSAEVQT